MADDGFTVLDMGQADLGLAKKAAPVEVVHVPVGKIVPNPYQPRKTFEEESLLDLASSIRQYGVLQPLLSSAVRKRQLPFNCRRAAPARFPDGGTDRAAGDHQRIYQPADCRSRHD
jgi:hypothetical protein